MKPIPEAVIESGQCDALRDLVAIADIKNALERSTMSCDLCQAEEDSITFYVVGADGDFYCHKCGSEVEKRIANYYTEAV